MIWQVVFITERFKYLRLKGRLMRYDKRKIIGLTEKVMVLGNNGHKKEVVAKIDTGATKSSIDVNLAANLNLGPVIRSKLVKSASGNKLRPVIETLVKFAGKKIKEEFTLADRAHMKYAIVIGQNILGSNFLIDPGKK